MAVTVTATTPIDAPQAKGPPMLELRTYTLASDEALEQYSSVHWARHIPSLAKFGVTTRHVWREIGGEQPRLFALVEHEEGADPAATGAAFMASPEFRADMEGFAPGGIVHVSAVFLEPTSADPRGT